MNDLYSLGLTTHDRVNNAMGGGIPKGQLCLVEGSDGAGKSVFMQRFGHGLASEGHRVAYISTELTVREFIQQMQSLSYDVVDQLLDEQLLFLHADTDTIATGRPLVRPLLEDGILWRADVVIVDRFTELLSNDPGYRAVENDGLASGAVQRILASLQTRTEAGKSILLTANPAEVEPEALRPIRSNAGLYLDLETSTVGQEVRKQIVVRRFEGMDDPVNDTINFSVEQGSGITIVTRSVA